MHILHLTLVPDGGGHCHCRWQPMWRASVPFWSGCSRDRNRLAAIRRLSCSSTTWCILRCCCYSLRMADTDQVSSMEMF